jgi:hypothetical protein
MGRPKSNKSAPTEYERLPETKKKNGFIYTKVARNTVAAVYESKDEKGIDTSTAYEVFKIVVGKPYSLVQKFGAKKGQVYSYPAAEKFPSDEDFGKTAWAYMTYESAMKKYAELSAATN